MKETEVVRCVRVSLECLANAAVGSPTVNLLTELVGNASYRQNENSHFAWSFSLS